MKGSIVTYEEELLLFLSYVWASLVAQAVKNLPVIHETQVQSLSWEDFPEGGNGNPLHCSCLENFMDRGAWQTVVHGVTRVGRDRVTGHTCVFLTIWLRCDIKNCFYSHKSVFNSVSKYRAAVCLLGNGCMY